MCDPALLAPEFDLSSKVFVELLTWLTNNGTKPDAHPIGRERSQGVPLTGLDFESPVCAKETQEHLMFLIKRDHGDAIRKTISGDEMDLAVRAICRQHLCGPVEIMLRKLGPAAGSKNGAVIYDELETKLFGIAGLPHRVVREIRESTSPPADGLNFTLQNCLGKTPDRLVRDYCQDGAGADGSVTYVGFPVLTNVPGAMESAQPLFQNAIARWDEALHYRVLPLQYIATVFLCHPCGTMQLRSL